MESAVLVKVGVGGDYDSAVGISLDDLARPVKYSVRGVPIQRKEQILYLAYLKGGVGAGNVVGGIASRQITGVVLGLLLWEALFRAL